MPLPAETSTPPPSADALLREAGNAPANEASAPLLPLPVPHYHESSELSEKPRVVVDIAPVAGLWAMADKPQHAVLRLMINELGEIDKVVVENSTMTELVEHTVTEAFRFARFAPGQIDGVPVKSQIKIEVMIDRQAGPR